MGLCKTCGKHNEDYYNYCGNEGNELSTFERKLMLNEDSKKYCDMCGHETQYNQTYCPECGNLLSQVVKRTKNRRGSTSSYKSSNPGLDPISSAKDVVVGDAKNMFGDFPKLFKNAISELKNFDYTSFIKNNMNMALKTAALSIGILSIFIVLFLQLGNSSQATYIQYSEMQLSYFKKIIINLAFMNAFQMKISSSLGQGSLAIITGIIIIPLITGGIIYASTRIIYGKKEVNTLPSAALCACVYSVIMMIISLFARYTFSYSYETMKFYIPFFGTFINALLISFIANIMALEKENSKTLGTLSNIFKSNMFVIGVILLAITIILVILTYSETKSSLDLLNYYGYGYNMYNSLIQGQTGVLWFIGVLIAGFVFSPWILLASHLVSIKLLVVSISLFTLLDIGEGTYILLMLIPIITLVMMGRMIKNKYGEEKHNIVALYSICYTATMGLISYFSTSIFKGNVDSGSDITSLFGLDGQNGNINLVMGTNLFATIIIVFIFSTIFMYVGYKTKKIEN